METRASAALQHRLQCKTPTPENLPVFFNSRHVLARANRNNNSTNTNFKFMTQRSFAEKLNLRPASIVDEEFTDLIKVVIDDDVKALENILESMDGEETERALSSRFVFDITVQNYRDRPTKMRSLREEAGHQQRRQSDAQLRTGDEHQRRQSDAIEGVMHLEEGRRRRLRDSVIESRLKGSEQGEQPTEMQKQRSSKKVSKFVVK